jgi:hypothetical protein
MDSSDSELWAGAGSCEHSKEYSASVKGVQFINQLNNFQLLKKNSAPFRLIGQSVRQLVYLY